MPESLETIAIAVAFLIPCVLDVYVVIHKRRANERARIEESSRLPSNDRFARDTSS